MDTYKHDQKQYMDRMNQTALSKFDLLKPYLNPTIKILDFGSRYSPDFIEAVRQTGASYTAYDKSATIQETFRTQTFRPSRSIVKDSSLWYHPLWYKLYQDTPHVTTLWYNTYKNSFEFFLFTPNCTIQGTTSGYTVIRALM